MCSHHGYSLQTLPYQFLCSNIYFILSVCYFIGPITHNMSEWDMLAHALLCVSLCLLAFNSRPVWNGDRRCGSGHGEEVLDKHITLGSDVCVQLHLHRPHSPTISVEGKLSLRAYPQLGELNTCAKWIRKQHREWTSHSLNTIARATQSSIDYVNLYRTILLIIIIIIII